MRTSAPLTYRFRPVLMPLLLIAGLGNPLAQAGPVADPPDRLTMELHLELDRQAPLSGGADRGQARLRQHLTMRATLQSMGAPMAYNPLDPDDAQRRLADAQRTQQRVQTALARRPTTPSAPSALTDPAAMQARAQQMMARCGEDRACLMREASAMSAAAVAAQAPAATAPGLQARLQAYGRAATACEREASVAARSACQARARQAAGGGDDATDPTAHDDDLPEPFVMYTGQADCGLRVQAAIDERIDGEFDDVQGRVPFTQTLKARADGPQPQRCALLQVVLDTRNGRVWSRAAQVAPELAGTWQRQERGRQLQRQDSQRPLDWREADPALQQRLLRLDANGRDELRVPLAGDGTAVVRVRWRFAPG